MRRLLGLLALVAALCLAAASRPALAEPLPPLPAPPPEARLPPPRVASRTTPSAQAAAVVRAPPCTTAAPAGPAACIPCYERVACHRAWRFKLSIPIWVPGVSGTFATGGVTVKPGLPVEDLPGKLLDVATELQFGFMGAFEASKGRWFLAADAFAVSLGTEVDFRLTDRTPVEADLWAVIGRVRAGARVFERPVRVFGSTPGVFGVDLSAGARVYGIGTEVRLADRKLTAQKCWVDPLAAVDFRLDLSRNLALHVTGDVGGFGVGSDFTWAAQANIEWNFAPRWWLSLGYATLDMDYGDSTADDFAWEIELEGPVVAIGYRF